MSIYFSKVIKAGDRQREFNFTQLPGREGVSYSVDVPDDRGERVYFQLVPNEEGRWVAPAEGLPPWVYVCTDALSSAIEEHKSGGLAE